MLTGCCLNKNLDKTPNSAFYSPGAPFNTSEEAKSGTTVFLIWSLDQRIVIMR